MGEQCDYCVNPLLNFLDSRLRLDKGPATKTCVWAWRQKLFVSHYPSISFFSLSGAQCKCLSVCSMKVCLTHNLHFSLAGVSQTLKGLFFRQSLKYFVLFHSLILYNCVTVYCFNLHLNIDSRSQSLQMIYLSWFLFLYLLQLQEIWGEGAEINSSALQTSVARPGQFALKCCKLEDSFIN